MPVLTEKLDDQVPRVVSHIYFSFTNFLDGCDFKDIQEYFQTCMRKIVYHI